MQRQAMAADHHVFDRGHPGKNPRRLERADQPHVGDLHRRQSGQIAPQEQHLAAILGQQIGNQVEHGGFPGAVRADHRGHLMRGDVERHVVGRLQTTKTLGEMAHAEYGIHGN